MGRKHLLYFLEVPSSKTHEINLEDVWNIVDTLPAPKPDILRFVYDKNGYPTGKTIADGAEHFNLTKEQFQTRLLGIRLDLHRRKVEWWNSKTSPQRINNKEIMIAYVASHSDYEQILRIFGPQIKTAMQKGYKPQGGMSHAIDPSGCHYLSQLLVLE